MQYTKSNRRFFRQVYAARLSTFALPLLFLAVASPSEASTLARLGLKMTCDAVFSETPPIIVTQTLDTNKESPQVLTIKQRIRRLVTGQDDAIETLGRMLVRFFAQMHNESKPYGIGLMLGPTGVGKTETVFGFAEAFGLSRDAVIKVDCGEFQQDHEISKLIGSPPGYVGNNIKSRFDQDDMKARQTKDAPFNIILFDEVEKAGDALFKILLGVLDKGTLTDGQNRRIDLRNTFIFMTSNLGVAEMRALIEAKAASLARHVAEGGTVTPELADLTGRVDQEFGHKINESYLEALRKRYAAEFINRLDSVMVYKPLGQEQLGIILRKEMGIIQNKIFKVGKHKIAVVLDEPAKAYLIGKDVDAIANGARQLKRKMADEVTVPLINLLGSDQVADGTVVVVSFNPLTNKLEFGVGADGLSAKDLNEITHELYGDFVAPLAQSFDGKKIDPPQPPAAPKAPAPQAPPPAKAEPPKPTSAYEEAAHLGANAEQTALFKLIGGNSIEGSGKIDRIEELLGKLTSLSFNEASFILRHTPTGVKWGRQKMESMFYYDWLSSYGRTKWKPNDYELCDVGIVYRVLEKVSGPLSLTQSRQLSDLATGVLKESLGVGAGNFKDEYRADMYMLVSFLLTPKEKK